MLDIKFIRENPDEVKKGCRKKQISVDIDKLLDLDKKKRVLFQAVEKIRAKKNKASKEIAKIKGKEKERLISEMKKVDAKNDRLEKDLKQIEKKLNLFMLEIPNLPRIDVKEGKDESENEVIKTVGKKTKFAFSPRDYMVIAEKLDLIDVVRAGKTSGSRFGYLKNEVALLEFAIIQFTFDVLIKEGFIPVVPPVMIKEKSMGAMGYLAHGGEEETYHFAKDGLYLVGTSEQSIGPMFMNEILEEKDLPQRYVSFSTCFRREAGSYGRDTKGILRVHQFDKVEMFVFTKIEDSDKEHEFLLSMEERLTQALKIPYQVVKMCTGDLGNSAARKYDIECWVPSEEKYRETHSTSNCTDFQARRLNIRYRKKDKGIKFVHTLNGTAFAVGRIIIAIIENYQTEEGNIVIPEVLRKYMNNEKKIPFLSHR